MSLKVTVATIHVKSYTPYNFRRTTWVFVK